MNNYLILALEYLKKKARTELFVLLLTKLSGIKLTIAKFILEKVWKQLVIPNIDLVKRKINKYFNTKKKKKKNEKLKNAKTKKDWLDTLDSDTDI